MTSCRPRTLIASRCCRWCWLWAGARLVGHTSPPSLDWLLISLHFYTQVSKLECFRDETIFFAEVKWNSLLLIDVMRKLLRTVCSGNLIAWRLSVQKYWVLWFYLIGTTSLINGVDLRSATDRWMDFIAKQFINFQKRDKKEHRKTNHYILLTNISIKRYRWMDWMRDW